MHPSERTTPALLRRLRDSPHPERDAYERWILAKRTLQPVALLGAAIGGAGACLRGLGPGAVVGGAVVAGWALVRVLDQAIGALGVAAAGGLLVGAGAVAALAGALAARR